MHLAATAPPRGQEFDQHTETARYDGPSGIAEFCQP